MNKYGTKLLPMKDYCERATLLAREDIIKKLVNAEDEFNHRNDNRNVTPKITYPVFKKMNPAPLHAFIKSILP